MSKAALITIFVVLVVGGALVWYVTQSSSYTPSTANILPQNSYTPATSTATTVTYTASGFSPSPITISAGDEITFLNSGTDDMRVASDPHPSHDGYPTSGGCVGSTFDSCSALHPGDTWSFTFNATGTWGYHNHLNPTEKGTVIVQ